MAEGRHSDDGVRQSDLYVAFAVAAFLLAAIITAFFLLGPPADERAREAGQGSETATAGVEATAAPGD